MELLIKEKFTDNPGHVLRIFDTFSNVPLTTSERKHDY